MSPVVAQRRARLLRSFIAGAMVGLVLAGCGSPSTSDGGAAGQATVVPADSALQFTAPLVGGGQFEGAAYIGRPVAFWFWAPT